MLGISILLHAHFLLKTGRHFRLLLCYFCDIKCWCVIYAEARPSSPHEFSHLSYCSWAFMLSTDIIRHSGYTQHTLDKEQSGSYQISFVSWGLVAVNVQGLFPSIQKLQSVTTLCLVPPVAVPQRALH